MDTARVLRLDLRESVRGDRFEVPVELTVGDLVNGLVRVSADRDVDLIQIPVGHVRGPGVEIGIANGQLDWYFEAIAPDRLAQVKARCPVHPFSRNITFFTLNTRNRGFNNLLVRQAVDYAVDRPLW